MALCPHTLAKANDSQDDALRNHDVVRVQVDGVPFWTGTDAGFVLGPRATRNRDESYMHTPATRPCFLGTLWRFAQRSIDTLAVGLPNTTFRRWDELKAALEGQHQVPDFSRGMRDYRQGEISVTVRDVIVCPQSHAAYVYASSMCLASAAAGARSGAWLEHAGHIDRRRRQACARVLPPDRGLDGPSRPGAPRIDAHQQHRL